MFNRGLRLPKPRRAVRARAAEAEREMSAAPPDLQKPAFPAAQTRERAGDAKSQASDRAAHHEAKHDSPQAYRSFAIPHPTHSNNANVWGSPFVEYT